MSVGVKGVGNRRSPRRALVSPVGLLWNGTYEVTRGLQIGEGGMLIESGLALDVRAKLVVSVLLPGDGAVIARAQVVYVKPVGDRKGRRELGLQFVDLDLHKRRWIRSYVAAKTSEEAEHEFDFERAAA